MSSTVPFCSTARHSYRSPPLVPMIAQTLRVSTPTMYRLLAERSAREEASA
jgi:hypothetical protein